MSNKGAGTKVLKSIVAAALLLPVAALLLIAVMLFMSASRDSRPPPAISGGNMGAVQIHPDLTTPITENPPEAEPVPARFEQLNSDGENMNRGELILVNFDHSYSITGDEKLVTVEDVKTASYTSYNKSFMLAEPIIRPLNTMMDAFYAETGLNNVTIYSAFRTLEKQQAVFDDWVKQAGQEKAETMAAQPGHSEHHTGLAFDIALIGSDGIPATFTGEGDYEWFANNSYKYGFILRYGADKSDITKTSFEPWHFRYVGAPHAYFIYSRGYCLEEYIKFLSFFEYSGVHLIDVYNSVEYEIYHCGPDELFVPADREYTISGNNLDGFIVTVTNGAVSFPEA